MNYSALQRLALRLIQSAGQAYTYTRVAEQSYHPGIGVATQQPSELAVPLVVLTPTVGDPGTHTTASEVTTAHKRAVMPASVFNGTPPAVGDSVVIGGVRYAVRQVDSVQPGAVPLVYFADLAA